MTYKYEPKIDFDPKPFIEAALQLIRSEDTNKAILLLTDMLPSFYRDSPPAEIKELLRSVRSAKWLTSDYASNEKDDLKPEEVSKFAVENLVRFRLIKDMLLENKGPIPHIIDLGPGDYNMPIGLSQLGCAFTYQPIGVYSKAMEQAKEKLAHKWCNVRQREAPLWFVAYEIIEHLENEMEIRQQMDRLPRLPDKVFCSTPLYTFSDGNKNWKTEIAHLRTYTPDEFFVICRKLFPEYNLQYVPFEIQMIIGELK
jgi:hypothetical protein